MARNTTVEKIVKDTLGITELKPEQQEAVELLLDGKNVFVTLPTGYGKSAIYQVLPLCTKSLLAPSTATCKSSVIIISPLTSLMLDQVTKLRRKGLQAVAIGIDSFSLDDVRASNFTYIFGSPEGLLQGEKWREVLLDEKFANTVAAIFIDEAHCIVNWYVNPLGPIALSIPAIISLFICL